MTLVRENSVQQINAALQSLQRLVDNLSDEVKSQKGDELEKISKELNKKIIELDQAIGDNIQYLNDNFVPNTRTVNNKALSENITLTASDVGALPGTTFIPTKTSDLVNDSGFITGSRIEINTTQSISVTQDTRAIIIASNVTLTLLANGSVNNSILDIYTTASTSIVYYTNGSSTSTLSMAANTKVTFIYKNGWKLSGAYGAVWN